jgi:pteridine reductase
MDLCKRAVLITGSKRIGASLAVEMARRGANVAVSYCESQREAEQTVANVEACGRQAIALKADLRCPDASRRLVDEVAETFGRLDVVIPMASRYARVPFDAITEEDWAENLAIDLSAAFFCAHAAVPHMRRQRAGRIIFFADSEAASGRPHHKSYLPYFVAKSGVVALGRAMALELASEGIFVNTLALGPILPADDATPEECAATARATPAGCWGSVAEVARAVHQLIESEYITGEVIRVDGGRHLI